jgi:hypothetical protein
MQENEFYCVKCRGSVKVPKKDICLKVFKNKRVKDGVPALRAHCKKCDTSLTKFVKHSDKNKLMKKYGKC